jgi:type II secretion system protein G
MKTAKRGFTLIELLVVVSIIGILATLITANMNAARSRARDAARKADLKSLQTALRMYYNDVGSYPSQKPSPGASFASGNTVYMNVVPDDPLPDQDYNYQYVSDDSFTLTACLENQSDTACDKDTNGNIITCQNGTGCKYTLKP